MAYFSQERKAKMAPAIRALCKKYGVSASLAVRNHMAVVLTVRTGAIDFIGNFNETVMSDHYAVSRGFTPAKDSIQVNPYHFQKHFSGRALEFLSKAFEILDEGNHDNSDIQTDYFDVGWYTDVNIGRWNKPYTVV